MEPTKSALKRIRSLHQKKFREETGQFIAEGKKVVEEAMRSEYKLVGVYTTDPLFHPERKDVFMLHPRDMEAISALSSASGYLAVLEIPERQVPPIFPNVVVALDGIRDPGNMGTILRTCDWFGFRTILCSEDSVDIYNPKVVQSAMGSLFRTRIYAEEFIRELQGLRSLGYEVLGADITGESVYALENPSQCVLIIGSESHGIREEVAQILTRRISIPGEKGAESLNASVAAGIILSSLHQRKDPHLNR